MAESQGGPSLPLEEHQQINVVVEEPIPVARRMYGIIGWTGDLDALRKIALDPEYGVAESR